MSTDATSTSTTTSSPVSPEILDQVATMTHDQFTRHGARVVHGVRELADRLEQELSRTSTGSDHGEVAATAMHALMWGIANLNSDQMIRFAHDADMAARDAEAAHA